MNNKNIIKEKLLTWITCTKRNSLRSDQSGTDNITDILYLMTRLNTKQPVRLQNVNIHTIIEKQNQ